MSKVFLFVASLEVIDSDENGYHSSWSTWVVSAHTTYQLAEQTIEEALVIGKLRRPPDADKEQKFLYEADHNRVSEYTDVRIEEYELHAS